LIGESFRGPDSGKLYCLDKNGTEIWSYELEGSSTPVAVADILEADGILEVIAVSEENKKLYCLDSMGEEKWEFEFSQGWPRSPVVADLDGDKNFEILLAVSKPGFQGEVYCLDDGGDIKWQLDPRGSPSVPALADLDGNADLEVLFGVNSSSQPQVVCLDKDGNNFYPQQLKPQYFDPLPWPKLRQNIYNTGCYLRPENLYPKVSLELSPHSTQIPIGDNLVFDITLTNNTDQSQVFYGLIGVWDNAHSSLIYLSPGYGPLTLEANQEITYENVSLYIPNNPQLIDTYILEVAIGTSLEDIWDRACFNFAVFSDTAKYKVDKSVFKSNWSGQGIRPKQFRGRFK